MCSLLGTIVVGFVGISLVTSACGHRDDATTKKYGLSY